MELVCGIGGGGNGCFESVDRPEPAFCTCPWADAAIRASIDMGSETPAAALELPVYLPFFPGYFIELLLEFGNLVVTLGDFLLAFEVLRLLQKLRLDAQRCLLCAPHRLRRLAAVHGHAPEHESQTENGYTAPPDQQSASGCRSGRSSKTAAYFSSSASWSAGAGCGFWAVSNFAFWLEAE